MEVHTKETKIISDRDIVHLLHWHKRKQEMWGTQKVSYFKEHCIVHRLETNTKGALSLNFEYNQLSFAQDWRICNNFCCLFSIFNVASSIIGSFQCTVSLRKQWLNSWWPSLKDASISQGGFLSSSQISFWTRGFSCYIQCFLVSLREQSKDDWLLDCGS